MKSNRWGTTILASSEDGAHPTAFALRERILGCELKVLPRAGCAYQVEQPWLFDRFMIEFFDKHRLFPWDHQIARGCVVRARGREGHGVS